MKRLFALSLSLLLAFSCLPPALAAEGAPSDWAAEEVNRAVELGLAPEAVQGNWQAPITRGEFAQLAIRYLAVEYGCTDEEFVNGYLDNNLDRGDGYRTEADFGDGLTWWERFSDEDTLFILSDLPMGEQRPYINSAFFIGIVNGKGDGTIYDPEGAITRQEAACMLARSYEILDPEDHRNELHSCWDYTDYDTVDFWARDDVATVVGLGVMGSTSDAADVFDPLGTYSREQAVLTFLRLYEDAPVSRTKDNLVPLEEISYQRTIWTALNDLGQTESIVEYRADTQYGVILALRYSGGMHFYQTLLFIPRDGHGKQIVLSDNLIGANWSLSEDERTFTYTLVEDKPYQLDLTTGQVTELA